MADSENIQMGLEGIEAPPVPEEFYTIQPMIGGGGLTYYYPQLYTELSGPLDVLNIMGDNITTNVLYTTDIHISGPLYDLFDLKGSPGQVLLSDANGVRWGDVSSTSPPLQTIDILDEGAFVATVSRINFYDGNDPNNLVRANVSLGSTTLVDVYISDRWAINESGNIYRNSNVGINNDSPSYDLDVTGNVNITSTLDVGGITNISSLVSSTSTDTGALVVAGGVGIGKSVNIGGETRISNLGVSTTTDTGALVVSGGVGVGKNVNIGGTTRILSSGISTNTSTGALVVTGGVGIGSNLNVGGSVGIALSLTVSGITRLLNTQSSTTKDTGSLVVEGGVGIEENLNVGGVTRVLSVTQSTDKDTGALIVEGGVGVEKNINVGGVAKVLDTTQSTDKDTGALIVEGGVGVEKNINVGGVAKVLGTTESTDKDTGSLVVEGGVGVEKNINVGGAARVLDTTESTDKDTGSLVVEGGVGVEKNINVGGTARVLSTQSSTTKDTGSLVVEGGVGIEENINVGGIARVLSTQSSTDKDTGALIVEGGVGIEENLNVGGVTRVLDTTESTDKDTGSLIVEGGVGVEKNLNVGGVTNVLDTTQSIDKDTGALIVEGGVGIEKNLNVGEDTKLIGTLELDNALIDINGSTAIGKTDYRLASVGTGVSWRPPGVQTQNAIWVTMDGNDLNSGYLEGDAKRTVGAAASIAQPGDTIFIRSGVYYEDNPIGLRTDVSVSGQDLRLVTIIPNNPTKDVLQVRRGCLVENLNFAGSSVSVAHTGCGAVAFPPTESDVNAGIAFSAVTGYTDFGPATEGPSGRWRSPYVRNCTNFMTGSIGMKINGDHATASTIGADLKSMVCDSFTQYNENGIGVSITNNGYAQLVSIFTINCDIGIYAATGGSCDLTNSNSSFGNFGLVAVGLGRTEFTGRVNADTLPESDTVVLKEVYDENGLARRPYDGQALWFKINLDNYPDTVGVGTISDPLTELSSITVLNGGSGYSATSPPNVIIRDADGTVQPKGPQGIIAEVSPTINDAGEIIAIDVISTGRNYLSSQNIVVDVEGNTGLATAVMSPIYYTVSVATSTTPSPSGITTTTFNEFVPYELFENDPIELKRISRILTSSHSFEYIGTGTDINTATPLKGAVPIKANEVVSRDGAQIPFTSTDQKGNFDIGEGIQIDQTTSTIRGRDFSRAIQAEVTPLILALR